MKTESELTIEMCVDQLLAVLDRDIENLQETLSRLNELRRRVVKQDLDALRQLLESIRTDSKIHQDNEHLRQLLRKKLAAALSCAFEDITLTYLGTRLTAVQNNEITKRKTKLQALAGLLKKEYAATQMLLADCGRFNRLLLKTIFETGQSKTITYKPTGTAERQTNTLFMNLQF